MEQWARPGMALLSRHAELTDDLAKLATGASVRQEGLWIDEVRTDERLGETASRSIRDTLGCEADAGTPILTGSHLVGWLVLHCTDGPRVWSARDRTVLSGVAHDLGGALLQALAHQDQLESVRKLREVDALKTEFVSRVSHELRTALTSIIGYLEMLAEESCGTLNPRQRKVLDIVQRNCARLLNLTGNLLTLFRVDENELHLEHTTVDLGEIVADVRHALTPTLQDRDLTLDISPIPPTPGFTGDPREIERLLLNLLTNAIKFTPDGGRVTLAAACSPESVVLVVSDTGLGISSADQVHLFRRFFRAKNAIEMEIPGTGLGLLPGQGHGGGARRNSLRRVGAGRRNHLHGDLALLCRPRNGTSLRRLTLRERRRATAMRAGFCVVTPGGPRCSVAHNVPVQRLRRGWSMRRRPARHGPIVSAAELGHEPLRESDLAPL